MCGKGLNTWFTNDLLRYTDTDIEITPIVNNHFLVKKMCSYMKNPLNAD